MHGSALTYKIGYKFRVFTNGEQLHESDSLAFDDLEEVWHEGAMTACELVRAMFGNFEPDLDWRMEISDAMGVVIYRFSFKAERLGNSPMGDGRATNILQWVMHENHC